LRTLDVAMSPYRPISTEHYTYPLNEERIAKYPLPQRDLSRLLIYDHGAISEQRFRDLPSTLPEKVWLAFNKTKVIQARLHFYKPSGARIEVFCLEPLEPPSHELAYRAEGHSVWKCLLGNARKWKTGSISMEVTIGGQQVSVTAEKRSSVGGEYQIRFSWDPPGFTFGELLEQAGKTPIPPYLNRDAEESDRERYQTVYGMDPGSVAAPTAGLHFTGEMMAQLKKEGIRTSQITLHVGAGTFVPVKTQDARDHPMHRELVEVGTEFLKQWARMPRNLLAVGTTTTRSLESLYWLGVKLLAGDRPDPQQLQLRQWENEQLPGQFTLQESLQALESYCESLGLQQLIYTTGLMIVPGYRFRTINGLITNFHMPGSTLLMLIAAFIGEDWKKVYNYALENHFRFLSYGDSSLLLPSSAQQ
ncbi:MAG: S-adenosylmethionine:tRNA ribosyltransferase-isomerase, partial [Bacteroidales bacterium]